MTTFDHRAICAQFAVLGDFVGAEPYGSGHINDTQLVTYDQAGLTVRYILQRINHAIFPRPDLLMENICRVTEHLRRQAPAHPSQTTLTVIPARDGRPWVRDADGNWFRMYLFIEHARSYDILETPRQAFEAARAFGAFQCHLADLPGPRLHETIANFHHTPSRFQALRQAIAADACGRLAAAQPEVDFILARERDYSLLVDLQAEGRLHERITHNDTKLNNVLLDDADGTGRAVIDLDTVMPGLPHYDFGDMVRTGTSPAAEDERDLSKVTMRFEMFEALLRGYLQGAGAMLSREEIELLPFSGKLITLEIGIRFLTDFLSGDTYFKVHREGHNLDRCRTQIRLAASIEDQMDDMMSLVRSLS